jgi:hypothetical protein
MAGVAEVVVKYVADTKQLASGLAKAESASKSTGERIKGMGKAAVVAAGAAGLGALVATFKVGIDEFSEAAKVGAQTEAVIKSTGRAANVTTKHVEDLAGALMQKSGVDDEAIQSGENIILTFKGIRNEVGKGNDVFDQTTKAALDMSVALGMDVTQSAMQLGKALNDPVKGMTKLQRVGVTFTDAQKKQAEAMVKSGDVMGAQKIILKELNSEFGGSAEAIGKTLPGQINILKQNFSNLAGQLVGTLAPAFGKLAGFMAKHPKLFQAIVIAVLALSAAMVALNVALAVTAALEASVLLPALAVVAALAAFVAVAILVYKHWGDITDAMGHWWDVLKSTILGAWKKLSDAAGSVMDGIKKAAQTLLAWLKTNWPYLVGILAGPFGLAVAAIYKHWDKITGAIQDGFAAVKRAISAGADTVVGWGKSIAGWIKSGVVAGLSGIGAAAWGVVRNIEAVFLQFKNTVLGWGSAIGGWIKSGIVTGITGVGKAIWEIVRPAVNTVIKAINALGHFSVKKRKLPGPIPDIPGFDVTLWKIPLLAGGGIVTEPTLALVGERGPEAVVPLSGSSPVGASYTLNLYARQVNPADIAWGFRRLELLRAGR